MDGFLPPRQDIQKEIGTGVEKREAEPRLAEFEIQVSK